LSQKLGLRAMEGDVAAKRKGDGGGTKTRGVGLFKLSRVCFEACRASRRICAGLQQCERDRKKPLSDLGTRSSARAVVRFDLIRWT
jgi:hypothetical protein